MAGYRELFALPEFYRHTKDREPCVDGPAYAWSNDKAPPAIGTKVKVAINSIGTSQVIGYFIEDGYLGLLCVPDDPPDWYVKQNGRRSHCHVFGAEVDL